MPASPLPPCYDDLTDAEIIRGIGNQLLAIGDRKPGGKGREHWLARELAWLESKGITPDDAIAAYRERRANIDLRCQNSAPVGTANGFGIHAAGPSALDVMAGKASVADIEAHERRKDAATGREIRAAEIEQREAALRDIETGAAGTKSPPSSGKKATVNMRMIDAIQRREELTYLSARKWADLLGCSVSSVCGTETWKRLADTRNAVKVNRIIEEEERRSKRSSRRQ